MVNPPPHLDQIIKGIDVEQEHTRHLPKDKAMMTALKIALDHLKEDHRYYDKLTKAGLEESKRLRRLSKITENLFSQGGGESDSTEKDSTEKKSASDDVKDNPIDTSSELSKQFLNIRQLLSNGTIKMDSSEIKAFSKMLDVLANKANQGSAGSTFVRLIKYIDTALAGIKDKSEA